MPIPDRAVTKAFGVKVCAELPVEAMQNIQVEGGRDSIAVVICSQQRRFVFHHVCAEQEGVSSLQVRLNPAE